MTQFSSRNCCGLLAVAFLLGGVVFAAADEPDTTGYNILWLSCEDLSPRIGCYGDSTVPTPNIDRLAAEGIRFTRAFSTTGVCAPSRFSFITGTYPTQAGAQYMRTGSRSGAVGEIEDPVVKAAALARPLYEATPPAGVRCFTEYLRAAGRYASNNSKKDYQFNAPVTAWDQSSGKSHYRNRNEGQLFFSVFNNVVTHESRLHGKPKHKQVVDPADVALPKFFPDTPATRKAVARQYDGVAVLDEWVGMHLAQLEKAGLLDSTIVFFFADHGDGLPRHKRWVYDSGTHIPLIVRYPSGYRAGDVDDRLVSGVDFAPTVLGLAGIEQPDFMAGQSFLDSQVPPRDYVFMHRDRMDDISHETIRSARSPRYRYVRNFRPHLPYLHTIPYRDRLAMMADLYELRDSSSTNPNFWQWTAETKPKEEFYDCEADPDQVNNLADDPKYNELIARHRAALEQWIEANGDPLATPEIEVVNSRIWPPDGNQPVTAKPRVVESKATPGGKLVTLGCDTEGASIGYRLGKDKTWHVYSGPFVCDAKQLHLVAHRLGWSPSKASTRIASGSKTKNSTRP